MAPDRGSDSFDSYDDDVPGIADEVLPDQSAGKNVDYDRLNARAAAQRVLAARAADPTNFTFRGIAVGLCIGVIICFSNIYFGLQTGWISGMSMPSALISFGFFKALSPYLKVQFTPVENVLVQSVAGSVGVMPLGCGFVGVIPALEYLLKPDENGPLHLSLFRLCLWGVGICMFGVVFAVPLRRQVIIKEKLKFPTGSATALMIGVLHGEKSDASLVTQNHEGADHSDVEESRRPQASQAELLASMPPNPARGGDIDWRGKIKILVWAFCGSSFYTVFTYFVPQMRNLPIFGSYVGNVWLWTLNPSPAYIGQGIIMGPATTIHMLLGAVLGWGILSPIAKHKGWAPGDVSDWDGGSKGWIVWVSLAIMLVDALVSLGWLILQPTIAYARHYLPELFAHTRRGEWRQLLHKLKPIPQSWEYSAISTSDESDEHSTLKQMPEPEDEELDAPPQHLVSARAFIFWGVVSVVVYFVSIQLSFPHVMSFASNVLALLFALLLSIMGVRALGSTDLNPVSGISKLTQLVFSLFIPASNPNGIIINLLAGGISEAGALQSGDLLQDLKTGHLLGASPAAQFYGQLIASIVGAVTAACIYRLYTNVYTIPSSVFQVPTAFVWVFTARLLTGKGLPPKATEAAVLAAAVFAVLTALRTYGQRRGARWVEYVPGGIAVAVGMYNTPNFTLARTIGGLMSAYWVKWRGKGEEGVVVLASGLILGEGLLSILNLGLESAGVPHL